MLTAGLFVVLTLTGKADALSQAFPGTTWGPGVQVLQSPAISPSAYSKFLLIMQGDGNLVLYSYPGYLPIWWTGTSGSGNWATFQSDGNFVVYSASSVPLWHTSTYGLGATALALQDDGNLVISSPVGPIWQTNTSGYTVTDNMYPTSTMNNPPCTGSYGWSGGENCQTQNSLVTTSVITYVGGLSTTTRDLIHSWNEYHYGPTDLAFIPRLAADEWEGVGDYTDIIFEHNSAIFPYSGYTWCAFAVSATSCDTHFVAFSSTAPSANVICHETGHALGLLHGVESAPAFWNDDSRLGCLVAPVPAGSSLALGGQNAGIINATY